MSLTYNLILYGILERERDSPNEVRLENEDGKIWVSALAKTLWTVCVYHARYFVGGYEGRSLLRFAKSSDC